MKAEGSCHHLPSSLSHLEVRERDLKKKQQQQKIKCCVTESTCNLDGDFKRLQTKE